MAWAKHRGLLLALAFVGYGIWGLSNGDTADLVFGLVIGGLFLLRWGLVVSGKLDALHEGHRQELRQALPGLLFASLYLQRTPWWMRWLGFHGRHGYVCGLPDGLVVVPIRRYRMSLRLDARERHAAGAIRALRFRAEHPELGLKGLATAEVQMGGPIGLLVELDTGSGPEEFYTSGRGLARLRLWEQARGEGRLEALEPGDFELGEEQILQAVRPLLA